MKNLSTKAAMAVTLLALSGAANADIVRYNFNDIEAGATVTDQFAGVTIGLVGAPEGEGPRAMIISDTSYGLAGGIALRPSTHPTGLSIGPWFDLEFTFDQPTDFFTILALDAEEPVSATAYMGNEIVDLIGFRGGSNYQVWELDLGAIGGPVFDRVVIDIVTTGDTWRPGPEIFDNLKFNSIAAPTPGAVTLLATSGLLAMRRRRIEA